MGAAKPGRWAKGPVSWTEGKKAFLSVVFTWDLPRAISEAEFLHRAGYRVHVGGPGVHVKTDERKYLETFARVGGTVEDAVARHNPSATFASRGCPVGCWFCIVPSMEGRTFTEIENFPVRPVLCDNNLSALRDDYQAHIVRRYLDDGVPLLDANSGFEPKTFTEDVYERWRPINRGPWRFAFDEQAEAEDVRRVLAMLRDVSVRKKRVYVLIGNEPFASCMDRVKRVISWGGEPHCQPVMKLNATVKQPWVRFDWTDRKLRDVARWANRHLWKYCAFEEYRRHERAARGPDGQMELGLAS